MLSPVSIIRSNALFYKNIAFRRAFLHKVVLLIYFIFFTVCNRCSLHFICIGWGCQIKYGRPSEIWISATQQSSMQTSDLTGILHFICSIWPFLCVYIPQFFIPITKWPLTETGGLRWCWCWGHACSWTQIWVVFTLCYCDLKDQAAFLERFSESIINVIIMKIFDENTASRCIINLSRKVKAVVFSSGLWMSGENSSTLSEYR